MQKRLGFILLMSILASAGRLNAQDSLTLANNSLMLMQPSTVGSSYLARWRLTGYAGYNVNSQQGYRKLYLTRGIHASLAADYFFGSKLGFGVLLGYQNLAVSEDYRDDLSIPQTNNPRVLPLTSLHSFMLTVGPSLSFPIVDRLSLNVELRGGVFYNDAPVLGTYIYPEDQEGSPSGLIVAYITPNDQRGRWGAIAFAGLQYQLTTQLSIGVMANGTLSSLSYNQITQSGFFTQNQTSVKTVGVQTTVSYRFSPVRRWKKTVQPPVVPTPICYAPILDTTQPSLYEIGASNRVTFRWRSGSPVYTEGEQYVFQLYTLPGNKLIYEKTTKDTQLPWPNQLIQPDSGSYFFYSVFTSRTDELERTCRSEPVVGTKGFYKRPSAEQKSTDLPLETVIEYNRKLYELRSIALVKADSSTEHSFSKSMPKGYQGSSPMPANGRPIAVPNPARLGIRIIPTLIHEDVAQQSDFVWPDSLVTPTGPTVYQYVISRKNGGTVSEQIHYLIVEPDGCTTFIDEATKNNYLEYHTALSEPSTPITNPPPANKER
ncbi:hypothetical protein HNV11_20725 [Spirosoma taeanense]|uniref:Type IX secretion system membrane protein PorP/SprF n=1 Tax=Spirosoma taeanense TaxID=2735870 RepID=A0A6M5YF43_9BACT|nr:hypothetical protein [Spirosoma taeanense]QJW91632.1 hypothetical protein HNV11_20725 [Spirosoma taeanense]